MTEIVQLIATYGILPVLSALVIWLIIHSVRSQKKFNEKQQQMNIEQQKANEAQEERLMSMMGQMMTSVLQIKTNTDTHHSLEEEEENRKVDTLINAQLQKLLVHVKANRVTCFQYHNGGKGLTGRSFQKMSMTHEIVDGLTAPVSLSYQNIPRTLYPILNKNVAEQGCYYVENIESIKETDPLTHAWFAARGCYSVFVGAIRATNDLTLGYVTIEFTHLYKGDLADLKKNLKQKTTKISGALELNNLVVGEDK